MVEKLYARSGDGEAVGDVALDELARACRTARLSAEKISASCPAVEQDLTKVPAHRKMKACEVAPRLAQEAARALDGARTRTD